MADSAVVITAGTGTNIDTRTEATNGNHRQVVVLGDPATNAGVAPVDATAGLKVDLGADNDVTVSGVSTVAEQQTQTTHLATIAGDTTDIETAVELIDDTVATLGTTTYTEAASKGLIVGAVRRDADTTLVDTTNEVGPLQMNAAGQLKVEVFSGETLPVSGTVAVTNAGITTIAGAVSGTEMQVDVLTMPTTTVTATNLDVRDLVAASDAVTVHGDVGVIDQLDLTNSNPAVVAIVDGDGTQITSFGGGTQYTEDAAAAANPVGTALMLVREDGRAGSLTTTDGDNVAARGNNKGELYVKTTDSDALLTTIAGDTTNIETSVQLIDDTVYTDGTGTVSKGIAILGQDGTNPQAIKTDASGELQVDVLSVIPGTGATNLGKAKDSAVGATDTGVAMLGRLRYSPAHSSGSDGAYDTFDLTAWHEVRTRDQRAIDLAGCNDYTVFTTLGNDTANLANSANHVFGSGAITFDKVNGAANTVFAGVQDTITAIDISEIFEDGGFVALGVYLPSLTNLDYVFLRVGTDSSNYNEWRWDSVDLSAAHWLALRQPTNQPHTYAGTGWDTSAITYVSFGIAMSVESQTLSGVVFDNVHFIDGRVTDSTIDATISSSVSTPNVNIHRIGGNPTDSGSGAASSGTIRTILATDDPAVTSLAALDNSVDGNYLNVNANIAGTDMVSGSGTATGALRVELPTNGTGVIATVGAVTAITNALPAGTNNIGDVDVLSVVPGTGATNLGKAVDTATGATDTGVLALATRDDALSALTPIEGDNVQLRTDANGALWVIPSGTITVTATNLDVQSGGADLATSTQAGAIQTAVELIDDTVYTDDTSTHSTGTSKGIGMMGVAVPTDTSISANDIGMIAMSTDRRQFVDATLQLADTDISSTNALPTKGVPSDIDINGSNANHADKYYTNAGAVTDGIIWSPAAGKRWHVTTLYINVSAAATVTLEDDLAGGDVARWKAELAANSGVVLTYDKEHPFCSAEDAADLIITTSAGNVYVQAVGYEV